MFLVKLGWARDRQRDDAMKDSEGSGIAKGWSPLRYEFLEGLFVNVPLNCNANGNDVVEFLLHSNGIIHENPQICVFN